MFMAFLRRFIAVHPRFRHRPLFLAGESYAGRYIPHFATEILKEPAAQGLNLQGVLIGNGWTHPMVQSESFPVFSYSTGLVSSQQRLALETMVRECRAKWDVDPYAHETWVICEKIQSIIPELTGDSQIGKINQYDVRLYDTEAGGEWPWRTTGEVDYLNRRDVRRALHVRSGLKWSECSDPVSDALTHEDMYPTVDEFRGLLPRIRVLVYNGQFDWICNHVGVERFLDQLDFEGQEDFRNADLRGLWVSGSQLAGYVKHGGNLSFVLMLGGSHMVPMDKRAQALDLLHRFIENKAISDVVVTGLGASDAGNLAALRSTEVGLSEAAALPQAPVPAWLAAMIGLAFGTFVPCTLARLQRSRSREGYVAAP